MRASEFEFRQRFWIIGLIFWAAFACYLVDRVNAGARLSHWLSGHSELPPNLLDHLVFTAGAVLSIFAASLRTWATSFLRTDVVHDQSLHADRLVADGPYRYVRNPLYLGTLLLALGMGLMCSRIGYGVLVVGNLIFSYRLILREEAELAKSQGAGYREYLRRVPRLLPAFTPRVPKSPNSPRWGQAFLGEGFFWIFALAGVLFAVTLEMKFWYVPMGIAFPFYFAAVFAYKRRSGKTNGAACGL